MKNLLAALVVSIVVVGGLAAYALTSSAGPSSTSVSVNSTNPAYNDCNAQIRSELTQGYEINTFVTTPLPKLGGIVCVNIILLNIDGRNMTQSNEGLSVSFTIAEQSGSVVFQKTCAAIPGSPITNATGSLGAIVGAFSCEGFWDTSQAYNGTLPAPGTYSIAVKASIPYQALPGMFVADSTATVSITG